MRILQFSVAGNAERIALAISSDQKAGCDKIPPAYPIENEKLAFIVFEMKGAKADKSVAALCNDLTTARTKNVALCAVGAKFDGVQGLVDAVKAKGINIVGEPHKCAVKAGLFGQGKITDADVNAAVGWAAKIVDDLAE
ncbi:MAG: hypothetical protein FWH02_07660 [Oscillospiraceae bacterium]|nr:hypothetical protein [Oscillospiraceae bacterium]